ncbi:hypothetical protein NEMBOFW57_002099 [Staphylotrichum longicolle]|uniref:DNA cross-link repair protein pso2/snm1 n=1 Tax=Staphylotrichum longicolle TaxID=669026 RepID=A0AAD4I4C9_9PEZI|nr:hypothetical protein NEMBOFW57_002099 [Staphylotrichum longicolle]
MAPSTTKTKPKPKAKPPKLSQTRLKMAATPQKPASASAAKARTPTTTRSNKPNASILSFFKKASEEGLFIEEGKSGVALEGGVDEEELDVEVEVAEEAGEGLHGGEGGGEQIYESSPVREQQRRREEGRYNEAGGAVKRRRLSLGLGEGLGVGAGEGMGILELGGKGMDEPKAEERRAAAPAKKKPGNPFLDDDSDSDSDPDEDGIETPTARVRLPPPAFDASRERDRCGAGPAKLTSATTISRVPLLRQQTSGAELGGDCNDDDDDDNAGDIPDGDPNDHDAEQLEDEDFTGEELKAMRYMEEQARLEAEAEGEEYEAMDIGDDDDEAMTESCPVCNGSLSGATPDQATAHVNSCLDGNPTPLPKPSGSVAEAEAVEVSKRFAKAAVPRPGQANPISLGGETGGGPSTSAFAKLMSGHAEDAAWATAAAAETASRGMPAYKRTCPFYKIMPGFSICVDAFRYGAVEGCQAYFLSHFHSDHYVGLTASWTHGPIYCSKVTGSLVKSQLRTAAKYVVELEFEKTVPVPDTKGVTVTMIPANHCPGSSLFLFEKTTAGRTQRILHCGDFRACPAHVEHPKLRPETVDAITGRTKQQKIDVCYLDTTYLNPRYSFPPQQDVIQACADLCARLNKSLLADDAREWDALQRRQGKGASSTTESVTKFFAAAPPPSSTTTTTTTTTKPSPAPPTTTNGNSNAFTALTNAPRNYNPNRLLVVCGTYSIGKERICVAIAKALRTKIYASPAKIRMCKQLGDPELSALLTPDPAEAQVHMQMLMELRAETLAEYLEGYKARREFGRIVGFRPSGWSFRPSAPTAAASSSNHNGGGGTSVAGSAGAVGANLPPGSLPTAQLLHGAGWRTRFGAGDLVPQRGATREAMCFGVPYSEHSSFRELAMFVMALRIERVVPTVNVGSEASRRRMKGWIDRWVAERRRGGLVRVLEEGGGERKEGGGKKGGGGGEALLWEGKEGKGGGVYW